LEKKGLTRLHQRLLYTLEEHEGLSVGDFMRVYGASKQALTRPLRELVAAGYVVERAAEHDRRVKRLHLTARGRALSVWLSEPLYAAFERAFVAAGGRDKRGWYAVMRQLAALSPTYGRQASQMSQDC
jgi:DNA-binding MarR family transcriptional regulator